MKNVQVFIMGAGKGSRIKYNLGSKMPKCLLPSCMVSPKYIITPIGDTILYRIVKSIENASEICNCNIEIDLMISHKSSEVRDYIKKNFENVKLHQIDWSKTSINTFLKCVEIAKNKNKEFDQYIFINGDTYIDNIESISYTLADMIMNELHSTSAVVEYFKEPQYVFSKVDVSMFCNLINNIYGEYIYTTKTLCDITAFDPVSFNKILEKLKNGFSHEWWEMAFYEEVNHKRIAMLAIPVRKITYDRVLYNTNNIRDDLSESNVKNILNSFNLNFKEEENFDV